MPENFSEQTIAPDIEIDPIELGRSFIARRRLIAIAVGAIMIVAAVVMMLTPNQYTSHASILPSGNRTELSGLMDLAGTFGLGTSSGAASENSSALYPSILRSNHVLDAVLAREFPTLREEQDGLGHLATYFDHDDRNQLRAALREATSVRADKKLGIVSIEVQTEHPRLSQAVLAAYLADLEDYLSVKRKTQARQNVAYLTDQIAERGADLSSSEDKLGEFMAVNRNWYTSSNPDLQTKLGRLKRDVTIKATTYQLLSEQLELARLEAQKSIPIVRILDEPSLPTFKSGPRRIVTVLFAGLSMLLILTAWIFLRHLTLQADNRGRIHVLRDELCDAFPRSSRVLRIRRAAESSRQPAVEDEALV